MSRLPVSTTGLSRRELRKAVIRLHLEMQRRQLRRESQLLVQPFRQAQGLGHSLSQQLFGGGSTAPWDTDGAALLGVLLDRGGRWQRLLRLGVALTPLLLGLRTRKGRWRMRRPATVGTLRFPNTTIKLAEAGR